MKMTQKGTADQASLDLKMKEIVQYVIKTSPYLLVCHNVFDEKLSHFVQTARYGIDNPPVPADFPDFKIAYLDVYLEAHGYIYLGVNEARKDVEEKKE